MEKIYSVEQREEAIFSLLKNESDDEEYYNHKGDQRIKTIYKKENLYSMEDSKYEEINKDEENSFMGTLASEYDSDMEGEVDLKEELISSLEELRKRRIKNNSLKEKLSKYQEENKSKEEEVKTLQEELHNLLIFSYALLRH